MASDLTTALLTGSGNAANMAAADPAMLAVAPQLSLAQAMMQSSLSGAPAYPAQAIGRLAQTLAGSHLMDEATGQLQGMYAGGVEAASRALPADHPLQKFLKSPDPYTRMIGMRNIDKALIQLGEGAGEAAKNPPLIERAGGVAAAKAPYEPGGTMTKPGGPSGIEEVPISAAKRAEIERGAGRVPAVAPVAPVAPAVATPPPPAAAVTVASHPPPAASAPVVVKPAGTRVAPGFVDPALYGGKPVETPGYKAEMETFGKAGGAVGDVIKEHIEASGKNARDRINALDTIESAMNTNGGKGIVTGPQAETVLKAKEWLNGMGISTDWVKQGMAQSEMIQKMNAQLASASAKAMTGRPTQFEFQAWQRNNPGLATSPEGTKALLDVLRQSARQDIDLGRLAQDKANWNKWPEVVDKYYEEHPLTNPLTGKVMRDEIAAAHARGGPAPVAKPAPAAGSFDDRFGAAYGSHGGGAPTGPVRIPAGMTPAEALKRYGAGTPFILEDGRKGVLK